MKLPRAIERASQRQKHHLFVTVNGEKQRIESSAIYYIEVRGHWLYLHLHNQTLEVSGSLQEIEDRLKDQQFSRCSNSYLVNLRHVDAVKKDSIVVGANTLSLSRGRRNTFLSDLANSEFAARYLQNFASTGSVIDCSTHVCLQRTKKKVLADSCCTGSNLRIFGFGVLHYRITRNPFE